MRKEMNSFQLQQLPRYHVMMDFPHVQGRRWVVLEEEYLAVARQRDRLLDEVEALLSDGVRLDAVQVNCWDVRFKSRPSIDDAAIGIEVVGHYVAPPVERIIGESCSGNLRAAIDQARTADADPPERPKYDGQGKPLNRRP